MCNRIMALTAAVSIAIFVGHYSMSVQLLYRTTIVLIGTILWTVAPATISKAPPSLSIKIAPDDGLRMYFFESYLLFFGLLLELR